MSQIFAEPDVVQGGTRTNRWMTVIFNNETTAYDDVVYTLMRATGCDLQEASIETWEAHIYGKAPVHFADKPECEAVAHTMGAIGVKTEVTPEWND